MPITKPISHVSLQHVNSQVADDFAWSRGALEFLTGLVESNVADLLLASEQSRLDRQHHVLSKTHVVTAISSLQQLQLVRMRL